MTKNIAALICGILFGLGLTISQMSNPDKVLAFLDITGNWDLSLMLVMFGALTTLSVAQYFILKRPKPVCDSQFHLPKKASEYLISCLHQFSRQALHAQCLGIVHPVTLQAMEWESPLPEDMQTLIHCLRKDKLGHA
jgi:hypothetical protein